MAVAKSVKKYLRKEGVDYDVMIHAPRASASRSAQAAHVSGEQVAKSVVLHDGDDYMLAVLPATHRLEVDSLERLVNRRLGLATEIELGDLFTDCEIGAVPAVGAPYGLEVMLDERLAAQPDIYFEAGDHRSFVHMSGKSFSRLMQHARLGQFSHHV